MRLRDAFRDLTDYNGSGLEEVIVRGNAYRTNACEQPDALFGFAFGETKVKYNDFLAKVVIDARTYFKNNAPLYLQPEIGDFLKDEEFYSSRRVNTKGRKNVFSIDIFDDFIHDLTNKGVNIEKTNYVYVSHPAQSFRLIELGKKFGLNGSVFIPKEVKWPKETIQEWIKSPKTYRRTEFFAKVHHLMKNWVPREGILRMMNIIPQGIYDFMADKITESYS